MSLMDDWKSTSESQYPIGTVLTAGIATWTKDEEGWWWERPDRDVRSHQTNASVSRLIDQGRIWPKELS